MLVLDSRSEGEIVLRKRDLNVIIGGILLDCCLLKNTCRGHVINTPLVVLDDVLSKLQLSLSIA